MMPMAPAPRRKRKLSRPRKAAIVAFWLLLWEIADHVVNDRLILAGPVRVVRSLVEQVANLDFWVICASSFGRLACGFLLAFAVSVALAVAAHRFSVLRDFVDPVVAFLKTVPMISFIIMLLIWVGNQMLTVYLALLVVLPFIYTATLAGLDAADEKMLEMAHVHGLSKWKRFLYVYRPALMPFLLSSCKVALGMSWKTGIMAEVIGTPRPSIGREMYLAKSYLDTPDLFAWTAVVIVLALLFEKAFMLVLEQAARPLGSHLVRGRSGDTPGEARCFAPDACAPEPLCAQGVCKSYGDTEVLRDTRVQFKAGGVYCLMGPSGMGKPRCFGCSPAWRSRTRALLKGRDRACR